jgi:hypothetical protein
MLDREVELPWAAELGRGREALEDGFEAPSRRRRMPAWPLARADRSPGPQRGGLEAKLFLTDDAVAELEVELELDTDGDTADEDCDGDDFDDYYDDFDGMDECGDIVELGTP